LANLKLEPTREAAIIEEMVSFRQSVVKKKKCARGLATALP
jgi:hypothetical protein